MHGKELGCPESTYQYLQRLRNHLISAKILHERYEILKHIKGIESQIAELEKQCFGKEKQ